MRRVLVVDDEENIRLVLRTLLKRYGYEVEAAPGGEEKPDEIGLALHSRSNRAGHAFVPVNCGAIPENLLDSELFGHKKGAFTDAIADRNGLFAEADGGTCSWTRSVSCRSGCRRPHRDWEALTTWGRALTVGRVLTRVEGFEHVGGLRGEIELDLGRPHHDAQDREVRHGVLRRRAEVPGGADRRDPHRPGRGLDGASGT